MKITPQDILTQEFNTKVKGFDKDEVKNFLTQIAEIMESENLEREKLKKEIDSLRENLFKLEKRENILRDTLVSAQKFSVEIKSNAEKEAELRIKEAEMKAEEIVNDAVKRRSDLKDEIKNLKFKRKEIESDIINLLNSLKELIESYHKEDEEFDKIEYLNK